MAELPEKRKASLFDWLPVVSVLIKIVEVILLTIHK